MSQAGLEWESEALDILRETLSHIDRGALKSTSFTSLRETGRGFGLGSSSTGDRARLLVDFGDRWRAGCLKITGLGRGLWRPSGGRLG